MGPDKILLVLPLQASKLVHFHLVTGSTSHENQEPKEKQSKRAFYPFPPQHLPLPPPPTPNLKPKSPEDARSTLLFLCPNYADS